MITPEEAAGKYDSRLRAKLEKLRPPGALEVWDAAYDEYSWIFDGKTPQGIAYSVTLHLIEEAVREGEGGGLALFLSIVQDGGQILGEWCPFNFTESLWCHKENGLARRVRMFEQLSDSSILDCLKNSKVWQNYIPKKEKEIMTKKFNPTIQCTRCSWVGELDGGALVKPTRGSSYLVCPKCRSAVAYQEDPSAASAPKDVKKYLARISCEYSLLVEAADEEEAVEVADNTPMTSWGASWSTIEVEEEE